MKMCLLAIGLVFYGGFAVANDLNPVVVASYLDLQQALASDDLKAALAGAAKLHSAALANHQTDIGMNALKAAEAKSLDDVRASFKILSDQMISAAKDQKGLYRAHCPMANADWLQRSPQIANPYFGKEMSECGTIKPN